MHRRQFTRALVQIHTLSGTRKQRRRVPRQRQPTAIQAQYYTGIKRLLDIAHSIVQRVLVAHLATLLPAAQAARGDSLQLDTSERLKAAIDETVKEFDRQYKANAQGLEDMARGTAERTASYQAGQLGAQLRAKLGVDIPMSDHGLAQHVTDFVQENVAFIKDVPENYLDEIGQRTLAAVRSGMRHEDLAQELSDRYDIAENRAALIARDQVGKFYGELNKVRQTGLGITRYIWQTAQDNRVRDEHELRQGDPFEWGDPPEDGAPGQAINCRCYAEPDTSEILDSLDE